MEDLQWKKESTKKFRYLMLFFIRLAEVLTSSIIPSIIGIIILFITPEVRVVQTMATISFIIFAIFNCIFWQKYVRHRPKRSEFYIMNGIVYLIYFALSFVTWITSDAFMYTIVFSDLRGFELFGVSTKMSLVMSHAFLILLMVVCENVSHIYYAYLEKKAIENGAEEVEIKPEEAIPRQNSEEVTLLTVDEVNIEYEREIQEATELIRKTTENVSDKNWDEGMVKGDGEEIVEASPVDPDNDIEDSDYVSEAYAREEMSVTLNYDVDSLWNKEIYENREIVTEYDDEVYDPEMFIDNDDSLWNTDMYKGKGEPILTEEPQQANEEFIDDDEGEDYNIFNIKVDYDEPEEYMSNSFEEYDSDSLWDDIKQGRE